MELSSIDVGIVGDRGREHIQLVGETTHDLDVIRLSASAARDLATQLILLADDLDKQTTPPQPRIGTYDETPAWMGLQPED